MGFTPRQAQLPHDHGISPDRAEYLTAGGQNATDKGADRRPIPLF